MEALNLQSTPGCPPLQSLITYLERRQLLLVLDNFEQVGEATSVVAELLAAVPGLKVLATSRSVLRLSGEHKLSVPASDLPSFLRVQEIEGTAPPPPGPQCLERAQAMARDFAR